MGPDILFISMYIQQSFFSYYPWKQYTKQTKAQACATQIEIPKFR